MKTLGLSDVIGPIMVGPSSSHTAGALRIAYMARRLCLAEPKTVEFRLLGSFAHTLTGHGTDKALVAGMLGLAADDLRIRDSFQLAGDAGLAFSFVTLPDAEYDHPNTIDMHIVDAAGNAMSVRGESIGGGAAVIRKIDDIDVRITGESTSIVVRQRDETGVLAHIAQSISDEGVNIATTRMYRERKGDIAYTVLETDQEVDGAAKAAIEDHPAILDVRVIPGDARPGCGPLTRPTRRRRCSGSPRRTSAPEPRFWHGAKSTARRYRRRFSPARRRWPRAWGTPTAPSRICTRRWT